MEHSSPQLNSSLTRMEVISTYGNDAKGDEKPMPEVPPQSLQDVDLDGADDKFAVVAVAKKHRRCCGMDWTKQRLIMCITAVVLLFVALVLLTIYVLAPKIAQASIDSSEMNLSSTSITKPSNTSFLLSSTGTVSNAGFLNAELTFPGPVTVFWTGRDGGAPDLPLGTLNLSPVSVSGGLPKGGDLSLNTTFSILNATNMGLFSIDMIHADSFSWLLTGPASATALGFTFNNLHLNKVVTINGFGGLKNVVVQGFTPSAGPNNALGISVQTAITNPSNITIDMGDLYFTFKMGTGDANMEATNVTMKGGLNQLSMNGAVVIPGATGSDVNAAVSSLGLSSNVVTLNVKGDHCVSESGYIEWLNDGFKTLALNVTMNLTDIAQQSITGSNLALSSSSINQAQENSFHLTGSGQTTNAGTMDDILSFPSPVSVYWTNRPNGAADLLLGTVTLSPVHVSGTVPKSGPISMDTTFQISDAQAYGLTFTGLTLSKVVTMQGFAGLPNPAVSAFNLPDSDSTGLHVVTTAVANNPSTITIDMGTIGFAMVYQGNNIGSLSASGVIMAPGANSLNMDGRMYTTNNALLSTLMTSFLTGGAVLVEHRVQNADDGYFLASPQLNGPIVSGLTIPAMTMMFNANDLIGNSVTVSASTVTANFNSPFTFRIDLSAVQTNIKFVDQSSGTAFSQINVPMGPGSLQGRTVVTSFQGQTLSAIPGQEALFSQFFTAITDSAQVTVGIIGSVSSIVSTDAGPGTITISNLPVNDRMTLGGLNRLAGIVIGQSTTIGGDPVNGLHLIQDIVAQSVKIGKSVISNMVLNPGVNTYQADVHLPGTDPTSTSIMFAGISNLMQGIDSPINLVGNASSVPYASLSAAVAGLNSPAAFPGQHTPFFVSGIMTINSKLQIVTRLTLMNPLGAPLTMKRLTTSISYNGQVISTADHTFQNLVAIPPGKTGVTEDIPLKLKLDWSLVASMFSLLGGAINVNSVNTIESLTGAFDATIQYSQSGIPIKLVL
ncbi:hypothetical protein HDU98_010480 [Podochytrium sp. JEL0797]|nr:hypothetical protein HDU98_010480 [Podochytrium sp. JEL0797]